MDTYSIVFCVITAVYSTSRKHCDFRYSNDTHYQVLYVSLFCVAIWSTFQDSSSSRTWMRVPLIAMWAEFSSLHGHASLTSG
jgi:hypothetical protein